MPTPTASRSTMSWRKVGAIYKWPLVVGHLPSRRRGNPAQNPPFDGVCLVLTVQMPTSSGLLDSNVQSKSAGPSREVQLSLYVPILRFRFCSSVRFVVLLFRIHLLSTLVSTSSFAIPFFRSKYPNRCFNEVAFCQNKPQRTIMV